MIVWSLLIKAKKFCYCLLFPSRIALPPGREHHYFEKKTSANREKYKITTKPPVVKKTTLPKRRSTWWPYNSIFASTVLCGSWLEPATYIILSVVPREHFFKIFQLITKHFQCGKRCFSLWRGAHYIERAKQQVVCYTT